MSDTDSDSDVPFVDGEKSEAPPSPPSRRPLTKNEAPSLRLDDLPFAISAESFEAKPFCSVQNASASAVVGVSLAVGGSTLVDSNSLVCDESKRVIGRVEEVFGPVSRPFYSVRVMAENFDPASVCAGDVLSFVVPHATVLNRASVLARAEKEKPSDASNAYNNEFFGDSEEDEDFSDDEAERTARKRAKARGGVKKKATKKMTLAAKTTEEKILARFGDMSDGSNDDDDDGSAGRAVAGLPAGFGSF